MDNRWKNIVETLKSINIGEGTYAPAQFIPLLVGTEALIAESLASNLSFPNKRFREQFKQLLDDLEQGSDPVFMARVLFKAARWAEISGYRQLAVELFKRAASAAKTTQWTELSVQIAEEFGELYRRMGEFELAETHQRNALTLADKNGFPELKAHALNNLGVIQVELGKLSQAKTFFQDALALTETEGDKHLEGHVYNNIGVVKCIKGLFDEALLEFNRSVNLRRIVSDETGLAESYHNLGKAYKDLGNLQMADDYFRQAYGLARKLHNIPLLADVSSITSRCFRAVGTL